MHGDAGKMASLVKCARCGKKPTVKSNAERSSWQAVANPPCNVGGGPRYDGDDGAANSAFTSGLRQEMHTTTRVAVRGPRSKERATTPSGAVRGPERFFYDRSSYTGTHALGGPERVAKGAGSLPDEAWKRPPALEIADADLPSLLSRRSEGHSGTAALAGAVVCKPSTPGAVRPSSRGGGAAVRPSTRDAVSAARPSSRGPGSRLAGPERFFYDKSTYTGTHTRGGPSSVAKGGGTAWDQSWKRPT